MRKRRSTITQQYSPTYRNKISANYLSLSLPGAHTNLQGSQYCSKQNEPSDQRKSNFFIFQQSTDENNFEKKRMERIQLNYQNSVQNYNKIYEIIDSVDQSMRIRMSAHQQSLLSVVKLQIEKMQSQCKNLIQQYNNMIKKKNKDEEIYYLKNQLDYFRSEALFHFQNNKRIIQQNKELKELIKNKDSIINDLNQIIKKKTIKILKQKIEIKKIEQKKEKFNQQSNKSKETSTLRQQFSNIKDNQIESQFLFTKMKRVTKGNAKQNTTQPKTQIRNDDFSSKKFKTNTNFNYHSTLKQKEDGNKCRKNWLLLLNFQKRRIKTEMESTSQRQYKNYQQVNGIKIINRLSIKSQGKSKSLWKFQSKAQL